MTEIEKLCWVWDVLTKKLKPKQAVFHNRIPLLQGEKVKWYKYCL